MSVQRYETADGARWRVRWREANGRMRSRTLASKREALAFDADVKSRRYRGDALPHPGRETLADAFEDWWRLRGSTLAVNTQRTDLAVWNAHVRDRFDQHRLADLASDPQLFEELTAQMRAEGVGPAAQRRTLMVISAVLTAAVGWKKISVNPIAQVPKPPAARQRNPRPFTPAMVELIADEVRCRPTKGRDLERPIADALLVLAMSYAGLRPAEALALRFGDVTAHTISVDKAVADGQEVPTKTGRARTVPLVEPLAEDFTAWRWIHPSAPDAALVFPNSHGGLWTRTEFNNWRSRVWKPAVRAIAERHRRASWLADSRPYDCRGSFVSLQLRAGASPLEVAAWAGHSPQVMFQHYARVIEDLVGEPRLSAAEQIRRARTMVRTRGLAEVAGLAAHVPGFRTQEVEEDESGITLLYNPDPPEPELQRVLERAKTSLEQRSDIDARLQDWLTRRQERVGDVPEASDEDARSPWRERGLAHFAHRG